MTVAAALPFPGAPERNRALGTGPPIDLRVLPGDVFAWKVFKGRLEGGMVEYYVAHAKPIRQPDRVIRTQ